MENLLNTFKMELKNRNYAFRTIKVYSRFIKSFLEYTVSSRLEPEKRI